MFVGRVVHLQEFHAHPGARLDAAHHGEDVDRATIARDPQAQSLSDAQRAFVFDESPGQT